MLDLSILEDFVNADLTDEKRKEATPVRAVHKPRLRTSVRLISMDQHHSHALVGAHEDNASSLKRPSNVVARALVDLKSARGLEALQRG